MRYLILIVALCAPNFSNSETLKDLFDAMNGKVIEFTGRIKDEGTMSRPFIRVGDTGIHYFDYSLRPSELRSVKEACNIEYFDYTCEISGKAEIDTHTGKIFLYIFEVDEVKDLN